VLGRWDGYDVDVVVDDDGDDGEDIGMIWCFNLKVYDSICLGLFGIWFWSFCPKRTRWEITPLVRFAWLQLPLRPSSLQPSSPHTH